MNREEILNMPAGREMDTLVAEKVMGYTYIMVFDEKAWSFHSSQYVELPPYSISDFEILAVVEKFTYYKIERLGKIYNVYIENDDNIRSGISQGDDLRLAICRAALLAVMEE
jgi:hypothetical protein